MVAYMQAKIYKPTKSTMQSGSFNKNFWILEFPEKLAARYIENIAGWTSSTDMNGEVKLKFDSQEEAQRFAQSHNILYEVAPSLEKKYIKKNYADNFK